MEEKEMEVQVHGGLAETATYTYYDLRQIVDDMNRVIYLNDVIDETVVTEAVSRILRYNMDDRGLDPKDRMPIFVYLNSPGGMVTDGCAMIDAMMLSKTPVYTVNLGICYSMALLIFMAGEKRFSMPNATFLLHDGATGGFDSSEKMKDRIQFESQQMKKRTKEYILARSNITAKKYAQNLRKEWYFYPQEAKAMEIVTSILGTDCDMDEILPREDERK